MQMLNARYQQLPSRSLNRRVHMWTYGWWGDPVIIFPSASGMAHEWQAASAIDTLRPLIEAGRIKLYCPETNCSESWSRRADDPRPTARLTRPDGSVSGLIGTILDITERKRGLSSTSSCRTSAKTARARRSA